LENYSIVGHDFMKT